MAREHAGTPFEADRDVPGLIVKFGDYPLHHGGVGAIRSLGRLGVPMCAITEDRYTPAAASRYLGRAFVWPTTGTEDTARLVEGLVGIGWRIGRPAVLVPTDEEASVLIAEHQDVLGDHFLFPRVDPTLPRRLASKQGLHELCVQHGIPSPAAVFPQSYEEIEEFAETASFPVVAKNREAFVRRRQPAVNGTTRIATRERLLGLARGWGERPGVILQEYLPSEEAEDWIVHAYFDAHSSPLVMFTGVKVRSWPPHAGMTANAYVVDNPELADFAAWFVKQIGFSGIVDLDLRLDRRDGQYKLLDFNPRMGAQFRLFENESGVDVVRAMHLDLTGRAVPEGEPRTGRRYIVENIDLPALLAYRRSGYTTPHAPTHASGTELAWLAADDLLPFLTMLARCVRPGAKHLYQLWRTNRRGSKTNSGSHSRHRVSPPGDERTSCVFGRDLVDLPVAVIGAGPFGLSTAAHLRAHGIPVRVFGEPMVSWRDHMPAGMLLKSTPAASNIDAPQRGHTLLDYCDAAGVRRLVNDEDIIPVETFIAYGEWFQQELVPELERVRVVSVDRRGGAGSGPGSAGFELKLCDGEPFTARAVVVATGLSGLAHVPPELAGAAPDGPSPTGPVSHASQHHDLSRFSGKDLMVVGAGQSALETAALAAEAGAQVRVVARGRGRIAFGVPPWEQPRFRPPSPFGRAWSLWALSYYPNPYRYLPAALRHYLVHHVLGPLGAWWLRDRFEGKVEITEVARIVHACAAEGRPALTVQTHDGRTRELSADHVIAGTGYRVDVTAMDFLAPELRTDLAVSRGTPKLGAGYCSSVPGLYFTGLPAAASYGPVMRFVCGTEFASPRLVRHLAAAGTPVEDHYSCWSRVRS